MSRQHIRPNQHDVRFKLRSDMQLGVDFYRGWQRRYTEMGKFADAERMEMKIRDFIVECQKVAETL